MLPDNKTVYDIPELEYITNTIYSYILYSSCLILLI